MSLEIVERILNACKEQENWTLTTINIDLYEDADSIYDCCDVTLTPSNTLTDLVINYVNNFLKNQRNPKNKITGVIDFDGTTQIDKIYKLKYDDARLENRGEMLEDAINNSNEEIDRCDYADAYVVHSDIIVNNQEKPIYLIAAHSPVAPLWRKYFWTDGKYKEINEKVVSLRVNFDAIVYDNTIYIVNPVAENVFLLVRSFVTMCEKSVEEIVNSNILSNNEFFQENAYKGFNPRAFVTYSKSKLEILKNDREKMDAVATEFGIIINDDGELVSDSKDAVEKIIKLLCNKAATDPIEEIPVETNGMTNWQR